MRRMVTATILVGATMWGSADNALAQTFVERDTVQVCVKISTALEITGAEATLLLAEANAIWRRYGVSFRHQIDDRCKRVIVLRSDCEARSEDIGPLTALAWVGFVEGRPRQLVFIRANQARSLLRRLIPTSGGPSLGDSLVPSFLGRILAHELGHVLLSTADHTASGLMRARYDARDVLRDPPSTYTLSAGERERLTANFTGATMLVMP